MSLHPARAAALVARARVGVAQAGSVEEALEVVAALLEPHLPVSRISLLKGPSERRLTVAGVWPPGPRRLGRGTEISLAVTCLAAAVLEDRPIVEGECASPPLLAEWALASEGLKGWIAVPVHQGARIRGVLWFAAEATDAFRLEHVPVFRELAATIEAQVLKLGERAASNP
ncbi:MAG: GAF domain-containing protein [Actinomycetota bacterium]